MRESVQELVAHWVPGQAPVPEREQPAVQILVGCLCRV